MLKACEIASTGIGFPSFFNDNQVITALMNNGIDKENAVNYGHYGCNNNSLSGVEDENREVWHNVNKYMEFALNNGKSVLGGANSAIDAKPLSEINSMDELILQWRHQLRSGIQKAKRRLEKTDVTWNNLKPFSFESVVMTDCINKASSFNENGSRYKHANNHMVGMATLANSLYAIDRIVYKEKRYTLEELVQITKNDWKGYKLLQAEVRNKFLKYGNDENDVDKYADLVSDIFVEEVQQASPCHNGRVLYPSIYSLWHHRALGRFVGATPDGRNAGENLSENQSPVYGTEINGPTAVLNSIAKLPLSHTPTGGVNVKFSPSFLAADGSTLKDIINAFFKSGGMHIQINVVDRETLENAKQSPDAYSNLLVRVVGYSAYFVTLSPEQQDEIIARTELGK